MELYAIVLFVTKLFISYVYSFSSSLLILLIFVVILQKNCNLFHSLNLRNNDFLVNGQKLGSIGKYQLTNTLGVT